MKNTIKLNAPNVQLVAHRGLSGLETENTASAFVAAGNRSYFGIETDVHRTVDGKYILIHDDTTGRVAKDDMVVEKTTYDTLRHVCLVDRGFDPVGYVGSNDEKHRQDLIMPSLEEYIRICKKYDKTAVLELKNYFDPMYVDEIIAIIRDLDYLDSTIFISFNLPNMICIRERLPKQPAQFLTGKFHDWIPEILEKYELDLDIHFRHITAEQVKLVHDAGRKVNVWTVDTIEDAQRMLEYGVDFITTNILE